MPTTKNLIRRNTILPSVQLCAGDCDKIEDIDHLFLPCNFLGTFDMVFLTCLVSSRCLLNMCQIIFFSLKINFVFLKMSIFLSIYFGWLVCVVWNERNTRVFRQHEDSLQTNLDKIKRQSYWWLKANWINLLLFITCDGLILYLVWERFSNRGALAFSFFFSHFFWWFDTCLGRFSALFVLEFPEFWLNIFHFSFLKKSMYTFYVVNCFKSVINDFKLLGMRGEIFLVV